MREARKLEFVWNMMKPGRRFAGASRIRTHGPIRAAPEEGGGFELPVPHGKLGQTSILFVLLPGGADVAHSATAYIAPTEGHLWADLTAPLEAAPR